MSYPPERIIDRLKCFMERNPAQTARIFQNTIEQIVRDSEVSKNARDKNW